MKVNQLITEWQIIQQPYSSVGQVTQQSIDDSETYTGQKKENVKSGVTFNIHIYNDDNQQADAAGQQIVFQPSHFPPSFRKYLYCLI